ncbi:MAG TPA: hypothetical protein VGI55_03245 [Solirubrobacteraceae bacterium]|jgi:hypothetical protein
MGLGVRIRKLWHLRRGVVVCFVLAGFAAIWSVEQVSLSPPFLKPRSLTMATSVAHVLVDTPDSQMIDLRVDTYNMAGLVNRAVLLGNVIASTDVESRISAEARIPSGVLRVQAPLTPQQASPPVNSQTQRHISDIVKTPNQYRIEVAANPTVPMLDIYAQTPTAASAGALANAAVDQLRAYLARVATAQRTPSGDKIRIVQLGRATGAVINGGVQLQVALVVFVLVFLGLCAALTFVARVRAGWQLQALSERTAAGSSG